MRAVMNLVAETSSIELVLLAFGVTIGFLGGIKHLPPETFQPMLICVWAAVAVYYIAAKSNVPGGLLAHGTWWFLWHVIGTAIYLTI